jgi:hypothetical protein
VRLAEEFSDSAAESEDLSKRVNSPIRISA